MNGAAGDYHLDVMSAAIDAGVKTAVSTDLDGHKRAVGALSDLGAYEWRDPAPIVDYLLGRRTFSGVALKHLDVNGDSRIDVADVIKILKFIE